MGRRPLPLGLEARFELENAACEAFAIQPRLQSLTLPRPRHHPELLPVWASSGWVPLTGISSLFLPSKPRDLPALPPWPWPWPRSTTMCRLTHPSVPLLSPTKEGRLPPGSTRTNQARSGKAPLQELQLCCLNPKDLRMKLNFSIRKNLKYGVQKLPHGGSRG